MNSTADLIEQALREVLAQQTWTEERDVLWGNADGQFIVSSPIYAREVYYHSLSDENHEVGVAILDTDSNLVFQENAAYAANPPRITIGYPPRSRLLHVKGMAKTQEGTTAQGSFSQIEQFVARVGNPYIFNLVDFRVRPTVPVTTSIYAEPGMYEKPSAPGVKQRWAGGIEALASRISALAFGKHQLAVIIFDTEASSLTLSTTAPVTASGVMPARDELTSIATVTLSTGQLGIGTVYLYNGQTSIEQADCLTALDPRLTWPPGNTASFDVNSILVDDDGNVLTDDDGFVLVEG